MNNLNCLFIMGAARSGTTMLASMLSANKNIIALPEMKYIHEMCELKSFNKEQVIEILKNHFMFVDLRITKDDNSFENIVDTNLKKTTFNIIDLFNKKHSNKKIKLWVEHTPRNFLYFEKLKYHFPNAKFIHLVRDGRAVYNSTKQIDWGYKDVVTGAKGWNDTIKKCLELESLYRDIILTVKYEDLTSKPKETILRICKFINIEYSNEMLISNGLITPSFTNKKYIKKLGGKASTSSQFTWINTLKKYEIAYFTFYNKKYLELYDYDIKSFSSKDLSERRKKVIRLAGENRLKKSSIIAHKRFNSVFKLP